MNIHQLIESLSKLEAEHGPEARVFCHNFDIDDATVGEVTKVDLFMKDDTLNLMIDSDE